MEYLLRIFNLSQASRGWSSGDTEPTRHLSTGDEEAENRGGRGGHEGGNVGPNAYPERSAWPGMAPPEELHVEGPAGTGLALRAGLPPAEPNSSPVSTSEHF